jgi:putative endonuclease
MIGYMYILECSDGSYYTGSTTNLELRLQQHQNGEGANHTKKRLPVKLVYYEEYARIDEAFYREKQVQGWCRKKKEALIHGKPELLPKLAIAYRDLRKDGFSGGFENLSFGGFENLKNGGFENLNHRNAAVPTVPEALEGTVTQRSSAALDNHRNAAVPTVPEALEGTVTQRSSAALDNHRNAAVPTVPEALEGTVTQRSSAALEGTISPNLSKIKS